MYSKCGKVDIARLVFDRIHKRDIVYGNSMIFGYGIHGCGIEAVSLFNDIQTAGLKPDDVTFVCLLSACSHSGLVAEGKKWFVTMNQHFLIVPRMEHYICMVDMLGRVGLLMRLGVSLNRCHLIPMLVYGVPCLLLVGCIRMLN